LVEALEQLGLKLRMKGVGYPPIRIIGQKITNQVSIPANVSSQYICVIVSGAKIARRYQITLVGEITSVHISK
jgi:5-enolpyruvylshikimate-3-phosphate synthase